MKSIYKAMLCALAVFVSCTSQNTTEDANSSGYTISLTQSTTYTNLPALQSFVAGMGSSGTDWLLLGGRTNGFHGFSGSAETFPFKQANQYLYAYDLTTQKLDSMPVTDLPTALQEQYTSSNMQHFQDGNYLYVSGGYGEINVGQADSTWTTYSTLSRISVDDMISAIQANSSSDLQSSVVYDDNTFVRATGGELYRLPDDDFYLVLGQDFEGPYSVATPLPYTQVYLDSVHVFTVTESATSISVDQSSFRYISDNLPDSISAFRRRDLVVVPAIVNTDGDVNITVYGGVFTSPNFSDPGAPFTNPIYLDSNEGYSIDSSYNQYSNIYSAPTILMYSKTDNTMFTSILGGMGEDSTQANRDNFTKKILQIERDLSTGTTTDSDNANALPGYLGSEADFMIDAGASSYMFNSDYNILDYDKLPSGTAVLVGYFYGGILSNANAWNPTTNLTTPTNVVYEVYVTKN